MNELAETLANQSEIILGLSKEVAKVTAIVSELANRIVKLEDDVNHIIENDYGVKRG